MSSASMFISKVFSFLFNLAVLVFVYDDVHNDTRHQVTSRATYVMG